MALSKEIVAYDMTHNTESEACDLLMEIECLGTDSVETEVLSVFGVKLARRKPARASKTCHLRGTDFCRINSLLSQ